MQIYYNVKKENNLGMIKFLNKDEIIAIKYAILNDLNKTFKKNFSLKELEKIAKENKTNFLYFNFSTNQIEIAWIYDEEKIENDLLHEFIHYIIFKLEGKNVSINYDNIARYIEKNLSKSIFRVIK